MNSDLELSVRLEVPPERAWQVLTDWPTHSRWMLATTVTVTRGDGRSVGTTLAARTGYGVLSFVDTMEVTEWDAEVHRCVVRHTGHLVRGAGEFAVDEAVGGSTVRWAERLSLPGGRLGSLGWPLVRPLAELGLRVSLDRLARFCLVRLGGEAR